MLILTRRPVETIYIGDEVTVTVLGVVGNQVRFGIEAPRSITIDRAEIHERKRRAALAGGSHADVAGDAGPLSDADVPRHDVDGNTLEDAPHEYASTSAGQVHGNIATLKLRR